MCNQIALKSIQHKIRRSIEATNLKHRGYWVYLLLVIVLCGCTIQPLPQSTISVLLISDGSEQQIESNSQTVLELLLEQNLRLSETDRVTPPETTRLMDQMTVKVTRVIHALETITNTVPFERKVVRDATFPEGQSRLIQSGSPGLREVKYRITTEDGVQVEKILISDTFITSPKDEIRVLGTQTELETVYITGTLAYLSRQDGWVIRENNRERRQLTSSGDLDGRVFELSPDGSLLLYTRSMSKTSTINELWLIRTTEANPNAIPLDVKNVLWADWSPTNRTIAWTTASPTDRPPGWRGENDLWTARLSTRNVLLSTKKILEPEIGTGYGWWGTRYTWSPDGEKLAFSLPQSIGFVDLDTAERTTLQTFAAYKTYNSWAWNPELTWTNDGLFLVSVLHDKAPGGGDSEESPVFDINALDVTGVFSAEIASETGMWAAPKISPDGSTILYGRAVIPYQSASSRYRLCRIDLDGSNQLCFYPPEDNGPGIEIPLWKWDPSGENIAYIDMGDVHIINTSNWLSVSLTGVDQITHFDWE